MPQSLKRFLSNFNVVAIHNSLDGFRNTLYVRKYFKNFSKNKVDQSEYTFEMKLWSQ